MGKSHSPIGERHLPTGEVITCTGKNDSVIRFLLDTSREKPFASRHSMAVLSEKTRLAEFRRFGISRPRALRLPAQGS